MAEIFGKINAPTIKHQVQKFIRMPTQLDELAKVQLKVGHHPQPLSKQAEWIAKIPT
jgi:hypothetical protein